MKEFILTAVLAAGCASTPPQSTRLPDSTMNSERKIKICVFNILTGLMLLPMQGVSAFKTPICEEDEKTKGIDL